MREDSNRPRTDAERIAFVRKVDKLQAEEGLTLTEVAQRYSLHRSTVAERLRVYRKLIASNPEPVLDVGVPEDAGQAGHGEVAGEGHS